MSFEVSEVLTNSTFAPLVKFDPLIVIDVPAEVEPDVGLILDTVGGVSSKTHEFTSMLTPHVELHCAVEIALVGAG